TGHMNQCSFLLHNHTASTEIYTHSLHDALPIFQALDHISVNEYPGGIVGPSRQMLGPVKNGGTITTGTPPGCWGPMITPAFQGRSEEHTSELQSRENLVCRLLLEKKKTYTKQVY